MSASVFVESLSPGHKFSVYVYKAPGRQPYAFAIEGEVTYHDTEVGRVTGFQTRHPGSTWRRVYLEGSNTKGNRRKALAELRETLIRDNLIAPDATFPIE